MLSGAASLSRLTLGEKSRLSTDARLSNVPANAQHSGLWQLVAAGTPETATGAWSGTTEQLLERSGAPGSAGTYVWQAAVAPVFDTQPVDTRIDEGQTARFSASATGQPVPSIYWQSRRTEGYPWYSVSTDVATIRDNGRTLTVTPAATQDGRQFRAIATSTSGTRTSSTATLNVTPPPVAPQLLSGPSDILTQENHVVTFDVNVIGTPTPAIIWQFRPSISQDWKTVPSSLGSISEDARQLNVTANLDRSGYQFRIIASNASGEVVSAPAELTVTKAPVAPTITRHPQSVTVDENTSASFSVSASGFPAPSIMWEYYDRTRNGWSEVAQSSDFTVVDGTSITVAGAIRNSGLAIRAVAENDTGRAVSNTATLTVTPRIVAVKRYAGANRYATNIALNAKTMVAGKPLFVATGTNFPDALSVGPAVALTGGSLVLTSKGGLDSATLDLIRSKKPSAVYIIGGTGVVSSTVAAQLKSATGMTPSRIAGQNRYETSSAIFTRFFASGAIGGAFVATGRDYPDALSAASVGGALGYPVLLVDGKSASGGLDAALATQLRSKGLKSVIIVGGTGVMSSAVATNIRRQGFNTDLRIWGSNRYATNLNLNAYLDSRHASTPRTGIWVATGRDFPDALSSAVPAGRTDKTQRLVLSDGNCLPRPVVSDWIKSSASRVTTVSLVGGAGPLKPSVEALSECR